MLAAERPVAAAYALREIAIGGAPGRARVGKAGGREVSAAQLRERLLQHETGTLLRAWGVRKGGEGPSTAVPTADALRAAKRQRWHRGWDGEEVRRSCRRLAWRYASCFPNRWAEAAQEPIGSEDVSMVETVLYRALAKPPNVGHMRV